MAYTNPEPEANAPKQPNSAESKLKITYVKLHDTQYKCLLNA